MRKTQKRTIVNCAVNPSIPLPIAAVGALIPPLPYMLIGALCVRIAKQSALMGGSSTL